jgi:hypothetical protein
MIGTGGGDPPDRSLTCDVASDNFWFHSESCGLGELRSWTLRGHDEHQTRLAALTRRPGATTPITCSPLDVTPAGAIELTSCVRAASRLVDCRTLLLG